MEVVLNGEKKKLPDPTTLLGLLELLELASARAAIEVNGVVITRAQHPSYALSDQDVVEVVTLVGGG